MRQIINQIKLDYSLPTTIDVIKIFTKKLQSMLYKSNLSRFSLTVRQAK